MRCCFKVSILDRQQQGTTTHPLLLRPLSTRNLAIPAVMILEPALFLLKLGTVSR